MHRCDWLSMKFPDELIDAPGIRIPTIYELYLVANSGDVYAFSGIGQFEDPIFKCIIHQALQLSNCRFFCYSMS